MLCATRDVRAQGAGAISMPIAVANKSNIAKIGVTRGLTLTILLSIFAINFMDRQILAILVEPIKRDLELSDTQIGILYGLAFAVLYSTAGIPIARYADRWNRSWIINCSLVLFSVMTAICGLTISYWQLVIARVGVAVGEGGTNPPSHSIISDLYGVDRRSTAMAVFSLGPHIGIILGFIIGGVIGQYFGWRVAFVSAGVMGFIISLLSFRFLQEPSRQLSSALPVEAPPISSVVRKLFRYKSMAHLFVGAAVWSTAAYAVIGWLASFLVRSHGLSISAAGTYLALILGLFGGVGTALGGLLADHLGRRNAAWRLRVVGIAGLVMVLSWPLVLWEARTTHALVLLAVPGALFGFYLGPTFAMVQSLVEPPMRATAAAALLFVINILGLGLGPLAVGALSDALQPTQGLDSLRLALLIVSPICLWASYHYYNASRTIDDDLARAHAYQKGHRPNEK